MTNKCTADRISPLGKFSSSGTQHSFRKAHAHIACHPGVYCFRFWRTTLPAGALIAVVSSLFAALLIYAARTYLLG